MRSFTPGVCTGCAQPMTQDELGWRVEKGVRRPYRRCLSCRNRDQRDWRQRRAAVDQDWAQHRRDIARRGRERRGLAHIYKVDTLRKYGLTAADYAAMLEHQGGVCAVCHQPQNSRRSTRLCVDHDHKTGRVRGLLCNHCNVALGCLNDDPERIRALADYVAQVCWDRYRQGEA